MVIQAAENEFANGSDKLNGLRNDHEGIIDYLFNEKHHVVETFSGNHFGEPSPELSSAYFRGLDEQKMEMLGQDVPGKWGFHVVLSWHPSERPTAEERKACVDAYIKEMGFEDRMYVGATHVEKEHTHTHLYFHLADVNDPKLKLAKLSNNFKSIHRPLGLRLSQQYGWLSADHLGIVQEGERPDGIKITSGEYKAEQNGKFVDTIAWKQKLSPIARSATSWDDLEAKMKAAGFKLVKSRGLSYQPIEGSQKKIKASSLGKDLSLDGLGQKFGQNYDQWKSLSDESADKDRLEITDARTGEVFVIDKNRPMEDRASEVIADVVKMKSVFTRSDLKKEIMRKSLDAADHASLEKAVLETNKIQIIGTDGRGRETLTTLDQINRERRALSATETLVQQQSHGVKEKIADKAIAKVNEKLAKSSPGASLSETQVGAVRHMLKADGISIIDGIAGSGKTTLVEAAVTAWKESGYEVIGTAVANIALSGLEEAGIEKRSSIYLLERNIDRAERLEAALESGRLDPETRIEMAKKAEFWRQSTKNGWSMEVFEKATRISQDLKHGGDLKPETHKWVMRKMQGDLDKIKITDKTVIVVDEAGMLSTKAYDRVLTATVKAGAKIVNIGDPEQIPAVEAGALLRAVESVAGKYDLRDVVRQKDQWQREATLEFCERQTTKALSRYEENGHLDHRSDTRAEAFDAMTSHYVATKLEAIRKFEVGETDRLESVGMGAHTRKDVENINLLTRVKLKEAGLLEDGIVFKTDFGRLEISEGDEIIFKKKDLDMGVVNADRGRVVALSKKSIVVEKDGEKIRIDPSKYQSFTWSYATTAHSVQGQTFDHFNAIATKGLDRNLTYVLGSRHKKTFKMFAAKEDFETSTDLKNRLSRDGMKENVVDYLDSLAIRFGLTSTKNQPEEPKREIDISKVEETVSRAKVSVKPEAEKVKKDPEIAKKPISDMKTLAAKEAAKAKFEAQLENHKIRMQEQIQKQNDLRREWFSKTEEERKEEAISQPLHIGAATVALTDRHMKIKAEDERLHEELSKAKLLTEKLNVEFKLMKNAEKWPDDGETARHRQAHFDMKVDLYVKSPNASGRDLRNRNKKLYEAIKPKLDAQLAHKHSIKRSRGISR